MDCRKGGQGLYGGLNGITRSFFGDGHKAEPHQLGMDAKFWAVALPSIRVPDAFGNPPDALQTTMH